MHHNTSKHWEVVDGKAAMKNASDKFTIWQLLRAMKSDEQEVPSKIGFISNTGIKPTRLTTIDYYPVINHPIPVLKNIVIS